MKIDFFDAVDVVCLDCHYLSEETCANCPVRKTVEEKNAKEVNTMKIGNIFHNDNGKDYTILAFDKDADIAILLNPENSFTPYVGAKFVRFGSWGSGHYFKTLQEACDWFNQENGSED